MLGDLIDPAAAVPDRATLLENFLAVRGALVDAFDRSKNAVAHAGTWDAVDHLDLAVSLLGPLVPQLADEVAARRPVLDIPDRLGGGAELWKSSASARATTLDRALRALGLAESATVFGDGEQAAQVRARG